MKLKDTVHFDLPKKLLYVAILFALVLFSGNIAGVQLGRFFGNIRQMGVFMGYFLSPDWSFLSRTIDPLITTIQMAVVGTVFGCLVAIPMSFLATTVVTQSRLITAPIRVFMNIVRTVPTLLLAALFVAIFGIGEVTGIITLAVFSFGIITKLMYDLMETIDLSPLEAAEAVGANRTQVAVWAVVPQISHQIASYALYVFEINIRASMILGYVGAGGIGVVLNSALGLFRYDRVSVIILVIIAVIVVIDFISEYCRKRLL